MENSMNQQQDATVQQGWQMVLDQMKADPVRRVSVRDLLPLTGRRNLTGRARVRIADALTSRGFSFTPASVLTERDHDDRTDLYIFGPGSQIARVLTLAVDPSEDGERQLRDLEGQLRSHPITRAHGRDTAVRNDTSYLWSS